MQKISGHENFKKGEKRHKKISGQWRQGRRVHAHMSPQGWVPIKRGGRKLNF